MRRGAVHIDNPAVRQVGVSRFWQITETWEIEVDGVLFTFLPGFFFDRASVPEAVPSWIISKDDLGTAGPAVHDAICQRKGRVLTPEGFASGERVAIYPWRCYSSDEAAEAFRLVLRMQGVPRWRARSACWAVKQWGPQF